MRVGFKNVCVSIFYLMVLQSVLYAQADTAYLDTVSFKSEIDTVRMADQFENSIAHIDSLMIANLDRIKKLHPTDTNLLRAIKNYDQLVFRDWRVFFVKIRSIGETQVEFVYPLNLYSFSVNRSEVSQIIFSDGRHEIFSPLFVQTDLDSLALQKLSVKDPKSWEQILLASEPSEVSHLNEIGVVSTDFEAPKLNSKADFLEKNALIILRKKAANLGGTYILITEKEINRPYGELPIIIMVAKVYGE